MAKNEHGQEVNDQRVNKSGRGKSLAISKFLPPDFDWVRVTRTQFDGQNVYLHIRKLELREADC